MRRVQIAALAILGFIGCDGAVTRASADPVYVSNVQTGYGDFGGITLTGPWLTDTNLYYTGQIDMTVNPGTSYNSSTANLLSTWCVDLYHDVYLGGQYQYSSGALATNNDPSDLLSLSTAQQDEILGLAAYGNAQLASSNPVDPDKNEFGAAVQVAIWETEYAGLGITDSNDPGMQNVVNGLLSLSLTIAPGEGGQLISQSGAQNQVFVDLSGSNSPNLVTVPEPNSILMLAAGLAGLGLVMRRRQKAQEASASFEKEAKLLLKCRW